MESSCAKDNAAAARMRQSERTPRPGPAPARNHHCNRVAAV